MIEYDLIWADLFLEDLSNMLKPTKCTKGAKRTSCLCVIILAFGILLQPAISQNSVKTAPLPWGRGKNDNNPNNGNMVQLKEAVQLDNLPDFTGHKKFRWGTVREWELGQAWSEYFDVKEQPKDVLSWYQQVFQMQQWKIMATNDQQIMAKHKDGNTCQISAQPVHGNPQMLCSLSIAYFVPKKSK